MVTESMFNSYFSCFLFSCLAKSATLSLGKSASTWYDWKLVSTCLTLLGWNMEAIIYLISSKLDGTEIAFFVLHTLLEIWSPYLVSFYKVLVVGRDHSITAVSCDRKEGSYCFQKALHSWFSTSLCLCRRTALLKS